MTSLTRLGVLAAVVLAGCASNPNLPPSAGSHLVYWDSAGKPIRQFDYPDQNFCQRVERSTRGARCQEQPVPGLTARATLRYNPPGVLVQGYYADLARCQTDNGTMAPGVELISGCAPR